MQFTKVFDPTSVAEFDMFNIELPSGADLWEFRQVSRKGNNVDVDPQTKVRQLMGDPSISNAANGCNRDFRNKRVSQLIGAYRSIGGEDCKFNDDSDSPLESFGFDTLLELAANH